MKTTCGFAAVLAAAMLIGGVSSGQLKAASDTAVGQLVAQTGSTAQVASAYAQGVANSFAYINRSGGINGHPVALDTVDYGYDVTRALAAYQLEGDPEAGGHPGLGHSRHGSARRQCLEGRHRFHVRVLVGPLDRSHRQGPLDQHPRSLQLFLRPLLFGRLPPLCSGPPKTGGAQVPAAARRSSATLTGPNSCSWATIILTRTRPRRLARTTSAVWDSRFCRRSAIRCPPADFAAQCQSLKNSGAHYAFLANTAESNVKLVKDCAALGVSTQFMTNIYGWDEGAASHAGSAGSGMVWVVSVAPWDDDVPGMKTVREISKVSDPSGAAARPVHYIRGVCLAYLMRDAMVAAEKEGAITGPNIKKALEAMRDHVPAGLEGVCLPTTFTPVDHRGTTTVILYRNDFHGGADTQKVYTTTVPLRPDWLGW